MSSGVVHPTAILIIPYVASTATFSLGDFAWKSPFDTVPADGHPLSLTNLQVAVGGVNQLATSVNYLYENFIQQVSKFNKSSSSEV